MKWKKLGKVFDPTKHELPNRCQQFAQSPQALVFDDFIRIYFSTRERDQSTGKFLSHIAFVDVEKGLGSVRRVSAETVIPLGGLGCFDEHGIFPMNILRQRDRVLGYTCGWNRRVSVSVDTSIGLAISQDEGLTFQRLGQGPILTGSMREPFLVGDPFVQVYNGLFHMWYIFGTDWKRFDAGRAPDRVYKIGHATSLDGIAWQRVEGHQIVDNRLGADECQALPTVVEWGGRYHMLFCYRQPSDFRSNRERGYRIGYACSVDLNHWTRNDTSAGIDVSPDGWDSDMLCYPHLFSCDGQIYLLYNGNEFGRYGFGAALLE